MVQLVRAFTFHTEGWGSGRISDLVAQTGIGTTCILIGIYE